MHSRRSNRSMWSIRLHGTRGSMWSITLYGSTRSMWSMIPSWIYWVHAMITIASIHWIHAINAIVWIQWIYAISKIIIDTIAWIKWIYVINAFDFKCRPTSPDSRTDLMVNLQSFLCCYNSTCSQCAFCGHSFEIASCDHAVLILRTVYGLLYLYST